MRERRLLAVILCFAASTLRAEDRGVSFNRDIRPILSDTCFKCHGPDAAQRTTDLRLDTRDGLFAALDGRTPVIPGQPAESELWRRITSDNPDERMPPPDSGLALSAEQVDVIRRWIEQGAAWQPHWAFVPPERTSAPSTDFDAHAKNLIDRFIHQRLVAAALEPSPRADKATLLRRLSLDLTGLPPTLDELDAFLADESPDAYDRAVDRLLASPAYGERMATPWLDAARYADTSGYQNDGPREMWRWRDWVIAALNANMPFDQFTVEQLAGDLLPDATLDQIIATGFHRNHRGNAEGGIIPEEYQVEYVVDRVATTGTVWLGLTIECARCHDHKYDPLTQREFYQLYAFFNNIPEHGRAIKEGNSPPCVLAPTPRQQERLAELDGQLNEARQSVAALTDALDTAQATWERAIALPDGTNWKNEDGLVGHFTRDGDHSSGRNDAAFQFDGSKAEAVGDVARFTYFDKFTLAAWVRPDEATGTIVSRMTPVDQGDGYYLQLEDGRLQVNLVKRWLDDAIRVETKRSLPIGEWHHVAFTYDGSRKAAGISIYIDGESVPFEVKLDALNQSFDVDQPLRIGGGHAAYRGSIDEVVVYARRLGDDEVRVLACGDSIDQILTVAANERSANERAKLRAYYLDQHADSHLRDAFQSLTRLERQRQAFVENLPSVMVMQEMAEPRETFVLERGQYDRPTETVKPDVPACMPELAANEANCANRLDLARWLVDRRHPLTARVAVNRRWQMFFGTGLVKTAEDFGMQGEPPSHPALLDWLAVEFIESGWDMKALDRLIVTSATYQQSSRVTPKLLRADPENRLLARGPRFRLPAEAVRDLALAAAGLLVHRIGGPSVKPYQPEGLWKELATVTNYDQSHGADLYRRGLYTYWKRTVVEPTMTTFDATARETCIVRRSRTNTPLQALTLMNDVTFVETARQLAARAIREGGSTDEARLQFAFRLLTSRQADAHELSVLRRALDRHREQFRADPAAAAELVAIGESSNPDDIDPSELAAFTAVMNLLLNLDETVTKE